MNCVNLPSLWIADINVMIRQGRPQQGAQRKSNQHAQKFKNFIHAPSPKANLATLYVPIFQRKFQNVNTDFDIP